MRVISGKFKTKPLYSPKGDKIRPTSDRIKETLFNSLYSLISLENAKVLDLFCGSGALGIETLSRGASHATFIDISNDSLVLTKKNIEFVNADKNSYSIYKADYKFALKKLTGNQFNIIFIDPPYDFKCEMEVINLILSNNILSSSGIIIIEHDTKNLLDNLDCSKLNLIKSSKVCGNTTLTFIKKDDN